MAKLPQWLRGVQKRARDKESRLRRRGANPAEVAAVSPRLDAATVASMSARQQRSYAVRLEKFISRKERFVVGTAGEILSEARLNSLINTYKAQYNRTAALNERRINTAVAGTPLARFGTVSEAGQRAKRGGITLNGQRIGGTYVAGMVSRIGDMEEPRSREAATRRANMFKDMARAGATADRRKLVRSSVEKMLTINGQDDLAARVASLSDTQFDVLTVVTNFMDLIKTEYAKNYHKDKGEGFTVDDAAKEATAFGDYEQALDLVGEVAREIS